MSWRAVCLAWVIALSLIACASDRPPDTILDFGNAADGGAEGPDASLSEDAGAQLPPERDASLAPASDGGARDAGDQDGAQKHPEADASAAVDAGDPWRDAGGVDAGAADAGEGEDAQVEEPFHCPGPRVSVSRSMLPFTLHAEDLTLTIQELAADATFALCTVPQEDYPRALANEQPVAGAFLVESDVPGFSARLTRGLAGSVLDALQSADGAVAPVVWRVLTHTGLSSAPGATMDLSERELASTLRTPGFVYLRHLDGASAQYALRVRAPASTYVTGEPVRFGFVVATADAQVERSVSLFQGACDALPVGKIANTPGEPACSHGQPATVVREAAELPLDGELRPHSTLDLTEGARAATFFCPYAGVGEVRERMTVHEAGEPVLTVLARATFSCTPSFDLVLAADWLMATRYLHGPLVATLAPYGTALPYDEVTLTRAAWLAGVSAFGADGVWYTGLTAEPGGPSTSALSFEGAHNRAALAWTGSEYVASYEAPQLASREPGLEPIDGPYFAGRPGQLTVRAGDAAISVAAAALPALDLRFAEPDGLGTELSFADGAADTVLISGSSANAESRDGFARWIRASDLPLVDGRRTLALLSSDQAALLADAPWQLARLEVAFMNVTWDQERAIWPDGRIVPVGAGTILELDATQLGREPLQPAPCGELVTDADSGCQSGPREVLLVAARHGVEMFSPVDGEYLGAFMAAGASEPDGFVQVVQGDTDHCLYASQHMQGHAGVLRYDTRGRLLDENPLALASDATPYGLLSSQWFAGQLWLVAQGQGGVDMLGPAGESYTRYEPTLASRGVTIGAAGVYASGLLAGDALGSIRRIWGDDAGQTHQEYFARELAGPEQIVMDGERLLVALSEQPGLAAYEFADGKPVRFIDELFAHPAAPRGVFPLLDGRWLVAGDAMGVQVVVPGTHVRDATPSEMLEDAAYISRACLP